MRLVLIAATLLAAQPILAQDTPATAPDGFKFLEPPAINQLLAKPQPGRVFGTALVSRHLDRGYYVEFVKRFDHGNEVEVHPAWIDQIAVTAGTGTLTYGGEVVNPRTGAGGEIRGDRQTGATTLHLVPGDFVIIPAGMPHKFVAASGKTLTYVIFKVKG